jgi:hypothetical protein
VRLQSPKKADIFTSMYAFAHNQFVSQLANVLLASLLLRVAR